MYTAMPPSFSPALVKGTYYSLKMQILAAAAFFVAIAFAAAAEKPSVCCREVSINKIAVPITGFQLQPPRPPCVKAVIFYTSEGAVCSHWKETWVKNKVLELRRLQAVQQSLKMKTNATTAAPRTAASTHSYNTTANN